MQAFASGAMDRCGSGDQLGYNFTFQIGEPDVQTVRPEGESLVIESELVEHGCIEVVDVDFVLSLPKTPSECISFRHV